MCDVVDLLGSVSAAAVALGGTGGVATVGVATDAGGVGGTAVEALGMLDGDGAGWVASGAAVAVVFD